MGENTKYHMGKISHIYGTQYGDGGGSQNYCYYKIGFVEDVKTYKRYSIFNMCRREIPCGCKEGLTRKVYWNLGQKVLFRVEKDEIHPNKRIEATKCGIEWNYQNGVEAIIIGTIDAKNNLIISVEDEHLNDRKNGCVGYSHYEKIKLKDFLENPNEYFLTFYSAG